MKNLICPICAEALCLNPQGIGCVNRHQYDRAKEGYFNLLPVQQKGSLEPGDARQQLQARRTFLSAGFFIPLVDMLRKVIPATVENVLDIGCGEGYFTQLLSAHCSNASVYGIDIAKAGVRMAAKNASTLLTYAVASSYSLPIADKSMDVITRIYAPSKDEELLRVLKPGGSLIIVTPGEKHLLSLRGKIYQNIKPYQRPTTPDGFIDVEHHAVDFSLTIPAGMLTAALLDMTPFAWKLTSQLKTELIEAGIQDQADFRVSLYKVG